MGLCLVRQTRPPRKCLICDFCSSDREFALGLVQIPPHGGHPCPQLTLPTAKRVVDFHHQVAAHSGQTHTMPLCAILHAGAKLLYGYLTKASRLFDLVFSAL